MVEGSAYTCVNCIKKEHSLLKDLNPRELQVLENHRSCVFYKKGETIFKLGTPTMGLLCLNMGKVKITKERTEKGEQIVALKKPVDFIGFRALMGNENYKTTATAIEASSVCIISREDFFKVVEANSDFAVKIIRHLAQELDRSDQRLMSLTQKQMRARVADALLLIHDVFGTLPNDPQTLNVQLKRSEIADLANMTTANLIRTLSAFNEEGIIETDKKVIRVVDLTVLKGVS